MRSRALVSIAAARKMELDLEKARELMEAAWQEHVAAWRKGGLFGPGGASRWCLEQLGMTDCDDLAAGLAAAIEEATSTVGIRLVEGADQALELLRSRGIPTALICDTGFTTSRIVRRALADHGLKLDHHFFSEEVGTPKPHPPIFRAALQAMNADPPTAVHIGDLRRTDVAGGRAAGMATVRFAGVHDDAWMREDTLGREADAVLWRWSDLPELLGL